MYLLVILSLVSFFLVASFYHGNLGGPTQGPMKAVDPDAEKLPGSDSGSGRPFVTPYHEPGR